MNDAFKHLHMPAELACEFLAVFSRIEYALKSRNFAIGHERRVDPAWDKFANEIDEQFSRNEDAGLKEATNFLLENPPRKQVLKNGCVRFVDQIIDDNQKTTQQLLLMVRAVRNNLFHGGKYLPDGEVEMGRNEILVRHSMTVLLKCVELNEEVYANFQY